MAKLQRGLKTEARIVRIGKLLELGQGLRLAKFALAELKCLERGDLGLGGRFFGDSARLNDAPNAALVRPGEKRKFPPNRLGQIAGWSMYWRTISQIYSAPSGPTMA